MAKRQPRAAAKRAVAAPMPRLPPVISMFLGDWAGMGVFGEGAVLASMQEVSLLLPFAHD
jgi:hypothetical protein